MKILFKVHCNQDMSKGLRSQIEQAFSGTICGPIRILTTKEKKKKKNTNYNGLKHKYVKIHEFILLP